MNKNKIWPVLFCILKYGFITWLPLISAQQDGYGVGRGLSVAVILLLYFVRKRNQGIPYHLEFVIGFATALAVVAYFTVTQYHVSLVVVMAVLAVMFGVEWKWHYFSSRMEKRNPAGQGN